MKTTGIMESAVESDKTKDIETFQKVKSYQKNRSKTCAIPSCDSPNGISYHRFPLDKNLQKIWKEACQKQCPFNAKNAYICRRHFKNDCFIRDKQNEVLGLPLRTIMKKGSIPTLHLSCSSQTSKNSNSDQFNQDKVSKPKQEIFDFDVIIYSIDPQGRTTVITIFVQLSIRHLSSLCLENQANITSGWGFGAGQVDY